MEPAKSKIVINHSEEDRELAEKLRDDIDGCGYAEVFLVTDILPGQSKKIVVQAINECSLFITLISSNSFSKGPYQANLKKALDNHKEFPGVGDIYVIPVRIGDCVISNELENIQHVDLFPSYEQGLEKILHVIAHKGNEENISNCPESLSAKHSLSCQNGLSHRESDADKSVFAILKMLIMAIYSRYWIRNTRNIALLALLSAIIAIFSVINVSYRDKMDKVTSRSALYSTVHSIFKEKTENENRSLSASYTDTGRDRLLRGDLQGAEDNLRYAYSLDPDNASALCFLVIVCNRILAKLIDECPVDSPNSEEIKEIKKYRLELKELNEKIRRIDKYKLNQVDEYVKQQFVYELLVIGYSAKKEGVRLYSKDWEIYHVNGEFDTVLDSITADKNWKTELKAVYSDIGANTIVLEDHPNQNDQIEIHQHQNQCDDDDDSGTSGIYKYCDEDRYSYGSTSGANTIIPVSYKDYDEHGYPDTSTSGDTSITSVSVDYNVTADINFAPSDPLIEIPCSFNPVGSGARVIGMGGAFIAVANDATAASWNPGGLTQLKSPDISIVTSFFHRKEDIDFRRNTETTGSHSISKSNINYLSAAYISNEELEMPISYGIGIVYNFSDHFTISADLYRTEWNDFILRDELDNEIYPVSGKPVSKSDVESEAGRNFFERKLIAIGINDYDWQPLDYAVSDAKKISESFSDRGYEVVLLTDKKANKTSIIQNLFDEISQSNPGDTFVLYIAGHGFSDLNGDRYILSHNDSNGYDIIAMAEIEGILKLHKGEVYAVIDTCFNQVDIDLSSWLTNTTDRLADPAGYNNPIILFGSSTGEKAVETKKIGSGLVTHILLKYLDKQKNPNIDFNEMFKYVRTETPKLARSKYKLSQHPVIIEFGNSDNNNLLSSMVPITASKKSRNYKHGIAWANQRLCDDTRGRSPLKMYSQAEPHCH